MKKKKKILDTPPFGRGLIHQTPKGEEASGTKKGLINQTPTIRNKGQAGTQVWNIACEILTGVYKFFFKPVNFFCRKPGNSFNGCDG